MKCPYADCHGEMVEAEAPEGQESWRYRCMTCSRRVPKREMDKDLTLPIVTPRLVPYRVYLLAREGYLHVLAKTDILPELGNYASCNGCISMGSAAVMGVDKDWIVGIECDTVKKKIENFLERPLELVETIDDSGGWL